MAFIEIEQKYRLKDPVKARILLKRMGARSIASGVESNEFFDRGNELRQKKSALRLRQFGGKAVLTLKGPRQVSRFTKRMEIETPVEYRSFRKILGLAGFKIVMRYKKQRETYKIGAAEVTVDFLREFGWFLEIEGAPQAIKKIERKLGLTHTDREERSYLHMLFHQKY